MKFSDWKDWALLPDSSQWLLVGQMLVVFAALLTLVSAWQNWRLTSKPDAKAILEKRSAWRPYIFVMLAASVCVFVSLWYRGIEVNHFPSQSMGEVLTVFCLSLLVSQLVLHFALGLNARGPGWAILTDVLGLVVLLSTLGTLSYLSGLSTAQRDLPPALQSYWFAPHIVALIFSYATLGIAGLLCMIYFVTRFWTGVFCGGRSKLSQALILGGFLLVPFVQVLTIPALIIGGLVFLALKAFDKLPTATAVHGMEKELDAVSFNAFAVGIPFLTAGLWMGAFWAQEAWANYWGWDSKENSALISWLIYIVYIHLRLVGGWRGEKAMAVLMSGALSIFFTFQIFGYLPDSQKSLHRYTDPEVPAQEGMQGAAPQDEAQATLETPRREEEGE